MLKHLENFLISLPEWAFMVTIMPFGIGIIGLFLGLFLGLLGWVLTNYLAIFSLVLLGSWVVFVIYNYINFLRDKNDSTS